MAVLVEGISVVVRYDAIDRRFAGGRRKFLEAVPNQTFCADDDLARVGFTLPENAEAFGQLLEEGGLIPVRDGHAVDFAVVEQLSGPVAPVDWLGYARVPFDGSGSEVAVCWLNKGPRMAAGLHVPLEPMHIATPDGWSFEHSLSDDGSTERELYMAFAQAGKHGPEDSRPGGAADPNAADARESAQVLETAAAFLDLTTVQVGRLRNAVVSAGSPHKLRGWAKRTYDEARAIHLPRTESAAVLEDEEESKTDGSGVSSKERLEKLGSRLKLRLPTVLRRGQSDAIPKESLDAAVTLDEEELLGNDAAADPDDDAAWQEARRTLAHVGPHESLLAYAVPEIYCLNAFRVTQLPVNATQREVTRQVEKISMAEKVGVAVEVRGGLMPLTAAPDSDGLRRAVERLRDPDERLVDEFFWFWPLGDGDGPDAALVALSTEGTAAAVQLWDSTVRRRGRKGAIALHNLAVVAHAAALDAELDERAGKLSEERRGALDSLWSTAFQRWTELLESDAFWSAVLQRAAGVGDPRLVASDVVALYGTLPEALATVSARLAVANFNAGQKEACKRVFTQLHNSGLPPEAIHRAVREALGPARARLKASFDSVEKRPDGAPREILVAAGRLLEQTEPLLLLIDMALPEGDATREGLHDDLALTVMGMTITYVNESEDLRGSIPWLERTASIAEGEAALDRVVENMDKAHEMVALKAAADIGQRARATLDPLRARLGASGGPAQERSNSAARELLVAAGHLLEQTEPLLLVIDSELPEGDARRTQMHDAVAGNVLNLTIGYINESEDLAGCLPWLERAAKIAKGKEVRDRVKESTRTVKEMAKARAKHERAVRSRVEANARRQAQAARAAADSPPSGAATLELEILAGSIPFSVDDVLVTTDKVRRRDVVRFERVGRKKWTIRVVKPQDRAAFAGETLYQVDRGQKPGALQLKPIRV